MRREEALALDVSCFDFRAKTVKVKQTLTFVTSNTTRVDKFAKNLYSLRSILLPVASLPYLRGYVEKCTGFLFPEKKNNADPITYSQFATMWAHIRAKLDKVAPGAASLHPHLFRHNYATMLCYSNVSRKKAAQLLGHASTQMIDEVYAHIDEEKERAAEKLNAVFSS